MSTDTTVSTDVDATDAPRAPSLDQTMEQWLFFEDGPLTKDQAVTVVAKAKAYAGMLHRILMRAHERRIWLSLGYGSWAEFCAAEFDVSRSRSYQLLDLAKVQAALNPAPADAPTPPEDPPPASSDELTEAQARPLAPFKGDQRAVRLIWARAREIAGPNDDPSQAQVQQAVDEWKVPADGELWRSEDRLVTGAGWTDGPVWWTWQTPSDGVKLYLGLGEIPGALTMHERALFKSEARYGDMAAVAADDLDNLVPRLIAELFARQVPAAEEVYEVSRLVADMNIEWGKRGPFTLDHDQVAGAFAELAHIYDDDYSWSDTSSHEPVDDAPAPAAVDPDDEVVDAEIIEDDEPTAAPADAAPGRRQRLLERLREVEAELAGDLPATRRLQLIQDRLNLEAELDGRPAPRPAAPASRPPAAAPPTTTSPASVGTEEVGDDGPGLPSSSTAPAPLKIPDDLPFDRMVADAISCMEAMLIDGQRPGDMRHSARWLRAVASHLENEATRREAAQQEAGAA